MTFRPDRLLIGGALPLLLALASACSSAPPGDGNGTFPPAGKGKYASLARCVPAPACPGPSCAANAVGAPDGKTVDMAQCPTLDLTWTSGKVLNIKDNADITLHLNRVAGITRVEASEDGSYYQIVGFIGGTPAATPITCLSPSKGTSALIFLGKCNTMTNVSHLRLTRDATVSGSIALDAVEAINFEAKVQ